MPKRKLSRDEAVGRNQSKYELITIKFSHYNEKARWALDRFGVPYREVGYLPIIHFPFVLWKTRFQGHADAISTKASTPVLKTPNGILCDSTAILHYVSEQFGTKETTLYPNEEAGELEKHYALQLGNHARRVAYFHTLQNERLAFRLAEMNVGGWQAKVWRAFFPRIRTMLTKGLSLTPDKVEKSLYYIHKEFSETEHRLRDGRRYLLGETFTAADLSFACMVAPALLVEPEEGYGARLPLRSEAPSEYARIADELRNTAAGRFALRMFREERTRHSA